MIDRRHPIAAVLENSRDPPLATSHIECVARGYISGSAWTEYKALGTVAGDLAVTLGAQSGVFIAGGIVPRLGAYFVESGFRPRFEAKGRLSTHLAAIPSYVVTHKLPAFLGCAAALSAEHELS